MISEIPQIQFTMNSPQCLLENYLLCSYLNSTPSDDCGIPEDLDFHKDPLDFKDYHKENSSVSVFKNQQTK